MSNTYQCFSAYLANRGSTSRERIQNRYNTLEGFCNPAIVASKFAERSGLVLEQCGYGLDRIAILEFVGEGVARQCGARLDLVVP